MANLNNTWDKTDIYTGAGVIPGVPVTFNPILGMAENHSAQYRLFNPVLFAAQSQNGFWQTYSAVHTDTSDPPDGVPDVWVYTQDSNVHCCTFITPPARCRNMQGTIYYRVRNNHPSATKVVKVYLNGVELDSQTVAAATVSEYARGFTSSVIGDSYAGFTAPDRWSIEGADLSIAVHSILVVAPDHNQMSSIADSYMPTNTGFHTLNESGAGSTYGTQGSFDTGDPVTVGTVNALLSGPEKTYKSRSQTVASFCSTMGSTGSTPVFYGSQTSFALAWNFFADWRYVPPSGSTVTVAIIGSTSGGGSGGVVRVTGSTNGEKVELSVPTSMKSSYEGDVFSYAQFTATEQPWENEHFAVSIRAPSSETVAIRFLGLFITPPA
jgi:hypothetical protein